jgi:LmbE family N-acetylglucosaminyl deacetylase
MTQPDNMRRALVIGAHPDDNEFGAGGFTAKLAAQGWDITLRYRSKSSRRKLAATFLN